MVEGQEGWTETGTADLKGSQRSPVPSPGKRASFYWETGETSGSISECQAGNTGLLQSEVVTKETAVKILHRWIYSRDRLPECKLLFRVLTPKTKRIKQKRTPGGGCPGETKAATLPSTADLIRTKPAKEAVGRTGGKRFWEEHSLKR